MLGFLHVKAHFNKLGETFRIPRYGNGTGGELSLKKSQFKKTKHKPPLLKEKVVVCQHCGREEHEVCVLHVSYAGQPHVCLACQERRGAVSRNPVPWRARDLPCSDMAAAIAQELQDDLPRDFPSNIVVRSVNHTEEVCETKPNIQRRFPQHPTKFPYQRKVVLVFLDMGCYDICFYGFIVYECNDTCPEPNRHRVYISLLDSVKMPKHVFPSRLRTRIYHSLVRG